MRCKRMAKPVRRALGQLQLSRNFAQCQRSLGFDYRRQNSHGLSDSRHYFGRLVTVRVWLRQLVVHCILPEIAFRLLFYMAQ